MQKLNNALQRNEWVKDEIKNLEISENRNTTYKNLQNAGVLRVKFTITTLI